MGNQSTTPFIDTTAEIENEVDKITARMDIIGIENYINTYLVSHGLRVGLMCPCIDIGYIQKIQAIQSYFENIHFQVQDKSLFIATSLVDKTDIDSTDKISRFTSPISDGFENEMTNVDNKCTYYVFNIVAQVSSITHKDIDSQVHSTTPYIIDSIVRQSSTGKKIVGEYISSIQEHIKIDTHMSKIITDVTFEVVPHYSRGHCKTSLQTETHSFDKHEKKNIMDMITCDIHEDSVDFSSKFHRGILSTIIILEETGINIPQSAVSRIDDLFETTKSKCYKRKTRSNGAIE